MTIRQSLSTPTTRSQPRWLPLAAVAAVALVIVASALWAIAPLMQHHKADAVAPAVAAAQTPDAVEAQAGPTGAPLLWVMKDADSAIYLFGSVHVLRQNLSWMDRRLFQAFDSADQAWFELPDLDSLSTGKALRQTILAPRPVLANGLTSAEKAQLERIINPYGLTLKDVERVKPWAMALMIQQLDVAGSGFSFERGADVMLFHRARDMKKAVSGFETEAQQYGFLSSAARSSKDDGTVALKRVLAAHAGVGRPEDDINVLAKCWRTGNEKALTNIVLRERSDPESGYDVLLRKRNDAWVPRIEAMLNGKGTVFITVGAAHLVGPDGLVAQLRAHGHTVTRLDPA